MRNNLGSTNFISFDRVGKTYPHGATVLRDVSFAVQAGEFVCLIGPSGCGKSTILKIIARLEEPTAGSIVRPQNISMVFQSGALFPWLTVIENVAIGLRAEGVSADRANKHGRDYLDMLGLASMADKLPRELSGGQRQRVGIARALAIKPSVLLMDEPFSALDAKMTHFLHEDLIKIWRETSVTIVLVSHSIEEAVTLAERIMLMKDGAIQETFPIHIPYPRHEQGAAVLREVEKIRNIFFR